MTFLYIMMARDVLNLINAVLNQALSSSARCSRQLTYVRPAPSGQRINRDDKGFMEARRKLLSPELINLITGLQEHVSTGRYERGTG